MAGVHFTKKQSEYLSTFVRTFVTRSIQSPCLSNEVKSLFLLVDSMISDGVPFTQAELDVLTFMLQTYFVVFGEQDIDPLAEQCYAKMCGEWWFDVPYYDRMLDVMDPLPYKGVRDYKLGT